MLVATAHQALRMVAEVVAVLAQWAEMLVVHERVLVDQEQVHIQYGLLLLLQVHLGFMLAVEAVQATKVLEHKG